MHLFLKKLIQSCGLWGEPSRLININPANWNSCMEGYRCYFSRYFIACVINPRPAVQIQLLGHSAEGLPTGVSLLPSCQICGPVRSPVCYTAWLCSMQSLILTGWAWHSWCGTPEAWSQLVVAVWALSGFADLGRGSAGSDLASGLAPCHSSGP